MDNIHGVGNLTKIEDAAWKERRALDYLILKIPAQSVAGVFVKLKVWDEIHGYPKGHGLYCDLIGSAIDDAQRLTSQEGSAHV